MRELKLPTKRLLLREFVFEDWTAMHEYASDPEVVRWALFGPGRNDGGCRRPARASATGVTALLALDAVAEVVILNCLAFDKCFTSEHIWATMTV